MTHTPEPWNFTGEEAGCWRIDDSHSFEPWNICERRSTVDHLETESQENGKRIVTCVNALAGIPSEQIERDAKLYPYVREMLRIVKWAGDAHGGGYVSVPYMSEKAKELLAKLGDDQ